MRGKNREQLEAFAQKTDIHQASGMKRPGPIAITHLIPAPSISDIPASLDQGLGFMAR